MWRSLLYRTWLHEKALVETCAERRELGWNASSDACIDKQEEITRRKYALGQENVHFKAQSCQFSCWLALQDKMLVTGDLSKDISGCRTRVTCHFCLTVTFIQKHSSSLSRLLGPNNRLKSDISELMNFQKSCLLIIFLWPCGVQCFQQ